MGSLHWSCGYTTSYVNRLYTMTSYINTLVGFSRFCGGAGALNYVQHLHVLCRDGRESQCVSGLLDVSYLRPGLISTHYALDCLTGPLIVAFFIKRHHVAD